MEQEASTLDDKPTERRGLLPRFTLKDGDTFLLADALGDVQGGAGRLTDDGLFTNDTRYLSRFELAIAGRRPSLLGAAINRENTLFRAHLTNLPLATLGEVSLPKGVIHIERSRFLWSARLYERLKLTNFSDVDTQVPLQLAFDADFVDIFEVQGQRRRARGQQLPPQVTERGVRLCYRGLDNVERRTSIEFSEKPVSLSPSGAEFHTELARGASVELFIEIGTDAGAVPSSERYARAAQALSASMRERSEHGARIDTSARLFNEWIERSRSDLALLTTMLPTGPYPYAGIPWFATQFGRDAIITALEVLWINPELAAGVLAFLASTQANEESTFRDSQPGKIMHETRRGEMAALGEVPFARYYGGVDTTPLFVMLAGAYEARTGDRTVVDRIWPALLAATAWIERRLDSSPTGFLDYARGERSGLSNQGWKDSHDSMFHADGKFPKGPIAVVEVQGYAYAALNAMAVLASERGDAERSAAWRARSEKLRGAIESRFWSPRMNYYAMALDGDGRPCEVYGSNAGHLLFCGVPGEEHATAVRTVLASDRFASGWGIRTLARGEPRYNPMSYHNGSIWPHDTSVCAAGLSYYGARSEILRFLQEIFEAANHFGMRLPELYCGFDRIPGQGPIPYPVACLPQAWASASVFLLLQAALGIRIDGRKGEVHIHHPTLPPDIESLRVHELPVAQGTIDLEFERIGDDVVVAPHRHEQSGVRVIAHL